MMPVEASFACIHYGLRPRLLLTPKRRSSPRLRRWAGIAGTPMRRTLLKRKSRQNADFIAKNLKQYGWSYIVIDEGWYLPDPGASSEQNKGFVMDADGRFLPRRRAFPVGGRKCGVQAACRLSSWGRSEVWHSYSSRHPEGGGGQEPSDWRIRRFTRMDAADQSDTCPWNTYDYGVKDNAAGQAYYDSLARQYAGWGVDFVKVDCICRPSLQGRRDSHDPPGAG